MATDWDDVRIFHEAVRSGDYSSAARKLGINRTTIGRRLERLERALGAAIWDQTEGGYRPNALGRRLLAIADTTEAALAELYADGPIAGIVRLAGTAGFAELLLPMLAPFLRLHPALSVEIIPALDAAAAVQTRLADLGIAIMRDGPHGLAGIRVLPFRQARYRAHSGGNAPIAWSHATALANPQGWARVNMISDTVAATIEVPTLGAMQAAVRAGIGGAWLWEVVGDGDPALIRDDLSTPSSAAADLWVVHRADMAASPRTAALRDALVAAIEAYAATGSSLTPIASPAAK